MKKISRFPFHPFLLALYPVMALLSSNIHEVNASVVVRPLILSGVIMGVVWGLSSLLLKSWRRAALLTTWFLVLFFTYGHIYGFLKAHPLGGIQLGRYRLLVPVYLVVFGLGLWRILRTRLELRQVNQILNAAVAALLIAPCLQIGFFFLESGFTQARISNQSSLSGQLASNQARPDIYYIILDSYGRADDIQKYLGYDNTPFLNNLREMGFFVADCSLTNYPSTEISLASSLNIDYLDKISTSLPAGTTLGQALPSLIKQSLVRKQLEEAGYKTVAFSTGYDWIEWKDANLYLEPDISLLSLKDLRPFEAMFIKSTALVAVFDAQSRYFKDIAARINNPNGDHIQRELFLLNQLEKMPELPGPKFVYAHVIIPHGPFVFGAKGEVLADPAKYENASEKEWEEGYVGEVQFINLRLQPILKKILAESSIPPLIVIQGDHGFKGHRYPILNAYYLPGAGQAMLYPGISPVNSFRLIFDAYFGTQYGLLQDLSYEADDVSLGKFSSAPLAEIPACRPK
jgi:hypothetical protein